MARFLIEVPHEATPLECAMTIQIFLKTGSHFLSHADWGCMDGQHKAWITVEVDSKEEARSILPPAYRSKAHIVSLCRFTMEQVNEMLGSHQSDMQT